MKHFALCSLAALVLAACQDGTEPEVGTRVGPRPSLVVTSSSAPSSPLAYVTHRPGNTVSVIDIASNTVVATIAVGDLPGEVAITPDGAFAYVPIIPTQPGAVAVIETASNTVVGTVGVGFTPISAAITPDGSFAYVANVGSRTVSVIATASNTLVATIVVSNLPRGVAITPDGSFAYVNLGDDCPGTVSVIEIVSNTVVATIDVDACTGGGVAITPDGAFAYVTDGRFNSVSVIETASNTVVGTISVHGNPTGVAITPDGAFAYVTNFASPQSTVSVIDIATNTVVTVIDLGGRPPRGVAITPEGTFVYVTLPENDAVVVISTFTNTVVATIDVGLRPFAVAITPLATINFAAFDIEEAEVDQDEFEVEGSFELGAGSDGIDVLSEDVTVTFDGFSQTIPVGSFFRDGDEEGFEFNDGVLKVEIRDDGEFEVKGSGIPELSGIDLGSPVLFSLQIGDDAGATGIPFDALGRFPAALLTLSAEDPEGDHTGSIDVVSMVMNFNKVSGDYEIILTADAANPFIGDFRININLFNPDVGTTARFPSFFSDAVNDFVLATPTTVITLTGRQPELIAWDTADRVFTNSLGAGNPDGVSGFRSSVLNRPFTFLTNEDFIAFEETALPTHIR